MQQPETKYVSVGEERVAYQAFGSGPAHLLLLTPGWNSVDAAWENVGHLRSWRLMSERFRVVMLDHRGFGVSDPIDESRIGDPAGCVEDALAVLDALGIDRACVIGEGFAALNAIRMAVDHPRRVERLALVNADVTGIYFGADPADVAQLAQGIREVWGDGSIMGMQPHFSDDRQFLGRYERLGARPVAAAAYIRNLPTVDVRPLLDRIAAPTLVTWDHDPEADRHHLTGDLGERIPDVRFVDGQSTAFYWGSGILEATLAFLSGEAPTGHRELATVLFTDVVDSTRAVAAVGDREWRQTLDFLDDLVEARAARAGGRVVKQTGDGHLVEFARPGDAVQAALAMCRDAPSLGVRLRAGIHTGEVERRESGDLGGLSVHVAARVAAVAGPGEVLISRTLADLLGSAGHTLTDRGEHDLKGVSGRWQLFAVTGA